MPSTPKPSRFQLAVAAGTALVFVASMPTHSAQADPVYPSAGEVNAAQAAVGNKAARIAVVEGQLKVSNARLAEVQKAAAMAAESYNLARLLMEQRTDAAKAAQKRAASAQKIADAASDKLGQFAAATYRQGGNLGQLEAFLSSKGPQEVLDRAAGIQLITDIRNRIMQDANASSVVASVLRRQAAQALALQLAAEQAAKSARAAAQAQVGVAAAETARIAATQSQMITELAALRNTSVALERQRQAGLDAEAERRAAAAAQAAAAARARAAAARAAVQARADARTRAAKDTARADEDRARAAEDRAREARDKANRPRTPSPVPDFPSPPPPPSRGNVSAVIEFARSQIGEMYLWGAAGPDAWDCSGLTMMAWAQAGVNLSHYTGWQWAETQRVPLSDLQPGDLVFYGDSGATSHHMGLYTGNGMMIEAPRAGVAVREASIWRSDIVSEGGRP